MTQPPALAASELFRSALEVVRSFRLRDPTVPPVMVLPSVAPRKVAPGNGPVRGVAGDIWQTADDLRAGRRTVDEVVAAAAARIAAHSQRLGAFEHIAKVEAATAMLANEAAAGRWRGPLHGIPVSVKDVIDVAGMPTTGSSLALPPHIADRDGVAVARLRQAGAVIMGKTVTHEFALGVTTPQSRNPWDEARLAGGSSGGAAIATVTGMALGSLGTDTRASIRVPAALSGAVGFRPTTGLIPTDRWLVLSWSMDVFAPMARSVRDTALLMDVLTDAGDMYRTALPGSLAGLRIGWADAFLDDTEAGVRGRFDEAVSEAERVGARIVGLPDLSSDDLELANAVGMIASRAEAAQAHREAGTDLYLCTPEVREQLTEAGNVLAADYLRSLRLRAELYHRFSALFEDVDLLLMPTSKVVAPPRDDAERYLLVLSENCIAWSLVGFPAISLYAGRSRGLPVGVQLVAGPGQDRFLLAAAHALETLLPPIEEWKA